MAPDRAIRQAPPAPLRLLPPGFIVAAVNLLRKKPRPIDDDIDRSITNLCRCGTYERVRRAIHAAARRG